MSEDQAWRGKIGEGMILDYLTDEKEWIECVVVEVDSAPLGDPHNTGGILTVKLRNHPNTEPIHCLRNSDRIDLPASSMTDNAQKWSITRAKSSKTSNKSTGGRRKKSFFSAISRKRSADDDEA